MFRRTFRKSDASVTRGGFCKRHNLGSQTHKRLKHKNSNKYSLSDNIFCSRAFAAPHVFAVLCAKCQKKKAFFCEALAFSFVKPAVTGCHQTVFVGFYCALSPFYGVNSRVKRPIIAPDAAISPLPADRIFFLPVFRLFHRTCGFSFNCFR